MSDFELEGILKAIGEKDRTSWEQTRVLAAKFMSCFSDEKLSLSDVFPLPWDEKIPISKPEKTKLDPEKVKAMEDLINERNV